MSAYSSVTVAGATARLYVTSTSLGPVEHTDDGAGPALLALHGGMGGYDQSLILARALLGEDHGRRIIAVSRPGYLGTPPGQASSPEAQAALLAALLDRLGVGRATVAAVSAGGPAALAFAAAYPERTDGLVLVSCASGGFSVPDDVPKRLKRFETICRIPGAARLLGWLGNRKPEKSAERSIADPSLRTRTLAHPEAGPLLLALQGSLFHELGRRLPGTIADTLGFADLAPLPLAAIRAPTFVLHGTGDRVVPFAHATRVAAGVPGAELMAVPDGEHVSLFTHLDAVRTRVAAFLAAHGL